jgi:hypothetical protein
MSFWFRELAGWALVGLGLAMFALIFFYIREGQVYRTMTIAIISVFVFRGGIHLLKVAVAARVCEQAAAKLSQPPARPKARP